MLKHNLRVLILILLLAGGGPAAALDVGDPYYAPYQGYLQTIGAPGAWDGNTGSANVIVAVLDSGVNVETPDLNGRVLPGISATGGSVLDGVAKPHGTQVASVAAMGINNGLGGAGVGNFSILPITVTNSDGQNTNYWLADGVRQAAANGAKVVVISLDTLTYNSVQTAAAEVADKALVFVAMGNTNSRLDPAYRPDYANLIFVSGTNGDVRATWSGGGSSWGPAVDLAAPATSVLVADPTIEPSGYGIGNGTSYAAPLAAGAAALAWSINPALTPGEVRSILYTTATDLGDPGWDETFGYGRVDLSGVATAAAATVPEPAVFPLLLIAALCLWAIRRTPHAPS